jgi:hypothetical protein
MMRPPPTAIDGAKVVRFADLSTTSPTGKTRHVVEGKEATDFAGLAIAQYRSGPGFYLFYCDDEWNAITDTYHDTIDAAIEQAEFEFGSIAFSGPDSES